MGVLSPEPSLPSARSVAELVTTALAARGQTLRAIDVLASFGLDYLASRLPQSLSFAETRAVELALALSTPSPTLVVLYEPLVDVAINLLGVVRERIQQLANEGACVVVTTSSPTDARSLSDEIFVLQRGSVIRDVSIVAAQNVPMLIAWVRPTDPSQGLAPIRRLAQALADRPEVSSVAWSDAAGQSAQAAELRLSGSDLDAAALALADAATEVGAVVEAITPASPGLTRLRAAADAAESLRRASAQSRIGGTNVLGRGGVR
jgi:ABC-type multidrug transport system ATPase subunit